MPKWSTRGPADAAIGLKSYGVPGTIFRGDRISIREPPHNLHASRGVCALTRTDGFLSESGGRACQVGVAPGELTTMENHLSFIKGGMAMMQYFNGFGTRSRGAVECGTVRLLTALPAPRTSWPTSCAAT